MTKSGEQVNSTTGRRRISPERAVVVATFVNSVGNGMLMTVLVLFFSRVVGLSVAEIGIALAAGGACRIVAGTPLGHLSDRFGARRILVAFYLSLACFQSLYVLVGNFAVLLGLSCVVSTIDAGAGAARGALIGAITNDPSRRVTVRARLRSMTNIGLTIGAALGSVALYFDSATGYILMILINSVSTLGAGVVILSIPPQQTTEHDALGRSLVLRDKPYILLTMLTAALSLHYSLLEVAIPLWISQWTDAPRSLVGVLLVINTVAVAMFQVRASKHIVDIRSAYRTTRLAGLLLFAACIAYGLAEPSGRVVAVIALVAGCLLHVVGEMGQAASSFLYSYEFAPPSAQGQYQGFWSTGFALAMTVSPLLYSALPLNLGFIGWVFLGTIFVIAAFAHGPALRWAEARALRAAEPPLAPAP